MARIRDKLIGQEEIFARFDRAFREDRLAHAYLILGPHGSGRTRTALALAQQILCGSDHPPCGLCAACRHAESLTHPDLLLVLPLTRDEADDPAATARLLEAYAGAPYHLLGRAGNGSIGIDRIRALKEAVAMAPVEGERRVVILSRAERMTEQAAQSALKLVEEPPPGTTLILTAEDASELLPTLVSRCQKVRVRTLPAARVLRILEEEAGIAAPESGLLAALAGGSVGRALEMKEEGVLELRDRVLAAFDAPARGTGNRVGPREIERRVGALERIWSADTAKRSAELLLIWYHDLLAARSGVPEALANPDRASEAQRRSAELAVEEIGRRVGVVEEMVRAVEQNVNPSLALSAALTRIFSGTEDEDLLLSS